MTKRRNQEEHDSMVREVVKHVKRKGHSNIKADLQGYEKPDLIYWESIKKGHILDITSIKNHEYIFEVETHNSIDDLHTEDQWKLFSANAKQHLKKFIVVVPKGSKQQAWQRAKQLGINVDDVWTIG